MVPDADQEGNISALLPEVPRMIYLALPWHTVLSDSRVQLLTALAAQLYPCFLSRQNKNGPCLVSRDTCALPPSEAGKLKSPIPYPLVHTFQNLLSARGLQLWLTIQAPCVDNFQAILPDIFQATSPDTLFLIHWHQPTTQGLSGV